MTIWPMRKGHLHHTRQLAGCTPHLVGSRRIADHTTLICAAEEQSRTRGTPWAPILSNAMGEDVVGCPSR